MPFLKKNRIFFGGPITQVLRPGAGKLLAEALEMEIEDFLSQYKTLKETIKAAKERSSP